MELEKEVARPDHPSRGLRFGESRHETVTDTRMDIRSNFGSGRSHLKRHLDNDRNTMFHSNGRYAGNRTFKKHEEQVTPHRPTGKSGALFFPRFLSPVFNQQASGRCLA